MAGDAAHAGEDDRVLDAEDVAELGAQRGLGHGGLLTACLP